MLFLPVAGPLLGVRLVRLLVGLVLFGVGSGLMLESELGLAPWDVLHQGLSKRFGLTVGMWLVIVAFVVLLLWLPLGERFGLGTLLNALIIGPSVDATTALMPTPTGIRMRRYSLSITVLSRTTNPSRRGWGDRASSFGQRQTQRSWPT